MQYRIASAFPIRKVVIDAAVAQFFGKRGIIVLCAVDHARDFRARHLVFQSERAVAISVDNAFFECRAYNFGDMLLQTVCVGKRIQNGFVRVLIIDGRITDDGIETPFTADG